MRVNRKRWDALQRKEAREQYRLLDSLSSCIAAAFDGDGRASDALVERMKSILDVVSGQPGQVAKPKEDLSGCLSTADLLNSRM